MKVLNDTCMAGSLLPALAEAGHEVECIVDWPSDPVMLQSWPTLRTQVRLFTLDKDFGELAVVRGERHSGIARLVGFTAGQQAHPRASQR